MNDGSSHAARAVGEPAVIVFGIPEINDRDDDQKSAEHSHVLCQLIGPVKRYLILIGPGLSVHSPTLEHDPEKWTPVFREDHAQTKKIERDDDLKKRHPALDRRVKRITSPTSIPVYFYGMRRLTIILVAVMALAMVRAPQPHFVPRPTGPMPAVNVP